MMGKYAFFVFSRASSLWHDISFIHSVVFLHKKMNEEYVNSTLLRTLVYDEGKAKLVLFLDLFFLDNIYDF